MNDELFALWQECDGQHRMDFYRERPGRVFTDATLRGLSNAALGAHHRLESASWGDFGIPNEIGEIAALACEGPTENWVETIWPAIGGLWVPGEGKFSDRLFSPYIEHVRRDACQQFLRIRKVSRARWDTPKRKFEPGVREANL